MGFEEVQTFLKDNYFLILGASALNLILTMTKFVQGPLASIWTVSGILGLAAGGYGLMLNQGAIKSMYAYPNFYPYGHPFYYMHMDAPEVRNNYGFGQVNVPRISNALAAKQIDTGNYQLTTVNPAYDFNHIYSYIQEEY